MNEDGEEDHVNSLFLDEAMQPGESYAFSGSFEAGAIDAEIWGTDADCGEALELLASGRVEAGKITCFEMTPTMAHTHLLWVWTDGGGEQGEFAICPSGSCSP